MTTQENLMEPPLDQGEDKPKLSMSFYLIWLGQSISLFGSALTTFSFGVWVFQETGSIMDIVQVTLYATLPALLLLPYTGGFADRHSKKKILIWSEVLSIVSMALLGYAMWSGQFELWHLYAVQVLLAISLAFQGPAAYATITLVVPKQLFGQASGMFGVATAISQISAPLLAASLLTMVGLKGIVMIDMATFTFALLGLLLAKFPKAEPESEKKSSSKQDFYQSFVWSFKFLVEHKTMGKIYLYVALATFLSSMIAVLVTPLVLSMYSPDVLARITSAGAVGALIAGVVMIAWGGPKKWTPLILVFTGLEGLALALAGYSKTVAVLCLCAFVVMLASSLVTSCTQIVWRRKIPKDKQGSFAGFQQVIGMSMMPLSAVVGGFFADYIFEPALIDTGYWAASIGSWFGVGEGRGTGFLFFVTGVLTVAISIFAILDKRLYNLENEVKDAF